jgi:ubiquinol-cytochrome c reductase iron-sulfur subunit
MTTETPKVPDDRELADMSRDELVELGTALDGVEVIHAETRWPVAGTRAEKRAERGVAFWLLLGGLSGLALLVIFLFWPWQYPKDDPNNLFYVLATPLYGLTFGLSILSIGIGAVLYQKRFIPYEIAVQDRHDGPSSEVDRKTIVAELSDTLDKSTIGRRRLIKMSFGIGLGAFGLGTLVAFAGGLIKNPWRKIQFSPYEEPKAELLLTGWTPRWKGETIYLASATGDVGGSPYIKLRPGDIDAGGMLTVFPWRESDGDGTTVESHEKLQAIAMGIRNPVMLIRIKPNDMSKVVKRQGQESFNYGDLFAFTKVCSHLGCPASLYEQQTYKILCPCHQSQFDLIHFARPIFGPAARALAQLPITIDKDGYLVANGDFIEPVGPAFWERKTT